MCPAWGSSVHTSLTPSSPPCPVAASLKQNSDLVELVCCVMLLVPLISELVTCRGPDNFLQRVQVTMAEDPKYRSPDPRPVVAGGHPPPAAQTAGPLLSGHIFIWFLG